MKTIILLFLSLPFWLSAQDKIPTISSELSRLIIEYEQECYADSSFEHTYLTTWLYCYKQVGNMEAGYGYTLDCDKEEHFSYTHKDPDWLGFREFIKRREK